MIAFDRVCWNFNPFRIARSISTQNTASWCLFHALCCVVHDPVHSSQCVTFVHRINKQEKYCLSLARTLTSRYPSRVDDRMKIERTSNMVNILEKVARNHNIVLQWRINKIASWMSLKSSEINNCSWIISTVLEYPFYSSSCCQTCIPSIVRPMNRLWELILKIFFNSLEMNRSVFFSMHLLWMTKKKRYFLRYLIFRERNFPGSISIQFLLSKGTILGEEPAGSLLCGFAFAFDWHANSFALSFNAYSSSWSSGIYVSLLLKSVTNLFKPWEILTQEWVLSLFKDIIPTSTP